MRPRAIAQSWVIGTTALFGVAQLWAAYHLSARIIGHIQSTGEGMRWLLFSAVVILVFGEMLTAITGTRLV
jgi:hypothetical protein